MFSHAALVMAALAAQDGAGTPTDFPPAPATSTAPAPERDDERDPRLRRLRRAVQEARSATPTENTDGVTPEARVDDLPPTTPEDPPRPASSSWGEPAAAGASTDIPPKPAQPPARTFETRLLHATRSGPLHYAFYYAPDYAAVATMGVVGLGMYFFPPPTARRSIFGPSHDPATGDTSEVYDPRYDRLLGAPYRADTVPSLAVPLVGNAAVLATGAFALARRPSFRRIHHFVLGAAQAQLGSYIITELLKSSAARLRPDYRDRLARYHCGAGRGDIPEGVDCTGVNTELATARARGRSTRGILIDADELEDGRRSFPSGHAAAAFSTATYLALFIGGDMVWGEGASTATRIPGVVAQIAVLTAASLVAATRLSDGRHHPEDVIMGAGVGSTAAAAAYFLHFDLQGRPLVRDVALVPFARAGGLGLGLNGLLPW